jgi:hypothetical protein
MDSQMWVHQTTALLAQRTYERPCLDSAPHPIPVGKKAVSLRESWHRMLVCVPKVSPIIARSLERPFPTAVGMVNRIRRDGARAFHGVTFNSSKGGKSLDPNVAAILARVYTGNNGSLEFQ